MTRPWLSPLLVAALAWPLSAGAHPPPKPEDTGSASEMLKKRKKLTPYESLGVSETDDKQAYQRAGFLDIAAVRVLQRSPVVVEIDLYEAIEPDPGGLLVFLVRDGSRRFQYAAYLPEPAEDGTPSAWGLFALSGRDVYEDRVGDASYARDGTRMTVTIPAEGLDLDELFVHVQVLSGPDNDSLWKDEAPNDRKALVIPP